MIYICEHLVERKTQVKKRNYGVDQHMMILLVKGPTATTGRLGSPHSFEQSFNCWALPFEPSDSSIDPIIF